MTRGAAFDVSGGLRGLHFCAFGGRQCAAPRPGTDGDRHRSGDILSHSRLGGSRHLRPLRRWGRRSGADSGVRLCARRPVILSSHLHRTADNMTSYVDGGPSSTRSTGLLRMEGREVFRQAVQHLSEVVDEPCAPPTSVRRISTGWFRIRRTAASIDGIGESSASRRKDRNDDRTPRQHLCRLDRSRSLARGGGVTVASSAEIWCWMEALGRGGSAGEQAWCAGRPWASALDREAVQRFGI